MLLLAQFLVGSLSCTLTQHELMPARLVKIDPGEGPLNGVTS